MEDPGYTALAPQEANGGSEHTVSEQDGKWKERKQGRHPPATPLTPPFQGGQVWEVAGKDDRVTPP